jgi:predicted amidohydrolase
LARFALLAQGEQIHIATYPPLWPFTRPQSSQPYDLARAIATRAAAHSFEGKLFTIVSAGVLDDEAKADLVRDNEDIQQVLDETAHPASMLVGPSGTPILEALSGQEGTIYAEIDVNQNIEHRLVHDITGGYQRFELFQLRVDRTPYTHEGVTFKSHSDRDPLAFVEDDKAQEEAESARELEA